MRTLMLIGTAAAVTIVLLGQQAAAEARWCRAARDAGGRACEWQTRAQCAAATEWLAGGTCYENPSFREKLVRDRVPRRKPRYE
jgi:hypothetical protein